ncbi:MAG: redoxin family protein [Clostridia bacterium]|nr:redoxin family protein [Clostridia bacterium]
MVEQKKSWWQNHRPSKRRLIQVYAALLHNANIKGFVEGEIYTGPTKNVCVPGFNCYSCPAAVGACPLGALQNALASSCARAPYYVLGILMLFGLTLGRTICGWLCPLGLIQELVHKLPTPKLGKNRLTRALSWLKYVILGVFVIAIPLAYSVQSFPVPAFCKYICPAGTLEGAMGLLSNPGNTPYFSMLGILFTRKFVILVLILTACIFIYRAFCRFICPLGAIYGLFARLSLLGVKVEASKCTHCGRCVSHCKMDVRRVGDHECIHCGECEGVCPEKAISWKLGSIRLKSNEGTDKTAEKTRRARSIIAWIIALAVLAGVLWYYNRPLEESSDATAQQVQAEVTPPQYEEAILPETDDAPFDHEQGTAVADVPVEDDTPAGNEVGMRCPDFTVSLYSSDGERFALADTRGKPVVINFWATWCTPCVGELPYFQQLYDNYGEQIELVAIHSNLVTDDVQAFIDSEGLSIPFALDADGSVIQSLGGSTMLPMTVVLDRDGKIVYNKVGSVTYAQLESLVTPLLAEETMTPDDEREEAEIATVPIEDDTPVGNEVGMRCPDFTVSLYSSDGEQFALADTRGKPTVINFWATWCTPCVGELPYFQQLYDNYGEQIEVVAIHSNLVTDDVQAFIDSEGLTIPFALDADGSVIKSLGGSTLLPMTVVLDSGGSIVYNKVGSVTYAELESLIAPLL